MTYSRAAQLLADEAITNLNYNATTVSAWFDYTCVPTPNKTSCKGAGRHQVHFDTNHTLTVKMKALREAGARGIAWWNTGSVDYNAADKQADTMWDAMSAFAGPHAPPLSLPAGQAATMIAGL